MSTVTVPDHAAILAAAEAITGRLAANAPASEEARRLDPDSVAAMTEAGIWRLLAPRLYGGYEAGVRSEVDSSAILSAADPAAGWLELVMGAHSFVVGSFDETCQDEVFGGDPDVRIAGTLAAQGQAAPVEGGWRLDGRWQFCSGVDHAAWVIIGSVADEHLPSGGRGLHVVVPVGDVEVDDTWFTLGLRGTGSKDVVARDLFVPAHRAMPSRMLFDGHSPHGERHATKTYRLPVMSVLSLLLGGAILGIAKEALRLHVDRTRPRVEIYTARSKAKSPGTQMRIAESSAELTAAELMLQRGADLLDTLAESGARATMDQRAELKWHAAYMVELCRRATDRIFAAAGAHAVYDDSRLQTLMRDMNTATHHATVDFDSNAEMFGRVALGLEPGTPVI